MGLPCIHAGHQLHGKGDGAKAKAAPVNRRVPALQTAEQPKAATPPGPLLLVGGETAVFPKGKTQIQPPARHRHLVDIRPQVFRPPPKGCNLRHPPTPRMRQDVLDFKWTICPLASHGTPAAYTPRRNTVSPSRWVIVQSAGYIRRRF